MSATFLPQPPAPSSATPAGQPPARRADSIDWRAARVASRACCCTARPTVIAVIPPGPDRRGPTDLLLCGHHYRKCREALLAAGAALLDASGAPLSGQLWPEDQNTY